MNPIGLPRSSASWSVTPGRVVVGEHGGVEGREVEAREAVDGRGVAGRDPLGPRLDQHRVVPEPREVRAHAPRDVGRRDHDRALGAGMGGDEDLHVAEVVVEDRGRRLARRGRGRGGRDGGRVVFGAAERPADGATGLDRHRRPHAAGRRPADHLHGRDLDPRTRGLGGRGDRRRRGRVAGGVRAGPPGQQPHGVRDDRQDRAERLGDAARAPRQVHHERVADRPRAGS